MKGFITKKENLPAVAREQWKSVKSLEGDELCANTECGHQRRYHLFTDGLCGYSETFCPCTKFVHSDTYQNWAEGAELLSTRATLINEPLRGFLRAASPWCVVVGEVARGAANASSLELSWGCESTEDLVRFTEMCRKHDVKFEQVWPGLWLIKDYGWPVKILATTSGVSYNAYRTVRNRAAIKSIDGIKLLVARPEDAPEPGIRRR